MKKNTSVAIILSLIIFSLPAFVFSQNAPVATPPVKPDALNLGEEAGQLQWLWGEVVTIDASNNQITVKYPDYETDQDKEMVITVDSKTQYENISSIADLKPQDNVSIDYRTNDKGQNIAENISIEKAEDQGVLPGSEEKLGGDSNIQSMQDSSAADVKTQ